MTVVFIVLFRPFCMLAGSGCFFCLLHLKLSASVEIEMHLSVGNCSLRDYSFPFLHTHNTTLRHVCSSYLHTEFISHSLVKHNYVRQPTCFATSKKSDSRSEPNPSQDPNPKQLQSKPQDTKLTQDVEENPEMTFPKVIPKKRRRGRRSEAAAVEDFVRDSLERTFASIRQQNSEILNDKENSLKDQVCDEVDSGGSSDNDSNKTGDLKGKKMMLEEEDPNWPLDADVGWGVRASEYFEKHPIKNVIGEDGLEIDWEGETDNCLVKEINCLEWESFAFHPSPLIVLVFERYNRVTDNWKVLKELEKAAKVYWIAKDRLPPRTVKIDINIERDLAYALKVRECPELLFLRGNMIIYREKEIRTADELVHMIAHFYYNAKKPSWMT